MKALVFSFVLMATLSGCLGVGRCDEIPGSVSTHIPHFQSLPVSEYMIAKPPDPDQIEKDQVKFVQDRLCPTGWKETNLSLRDYNNNVFDAWVRVEMCPENGLLRLRP